MLLITGQEPLIYRIRRITRVPSRRRKWMLHSYIFRLLCVYICMCTRVISRYNTSRHNESAPILIIFDRTGSDFKLSARFEQRFRAFHSLSVSPSTRNKPFEQTISTPPVRSLVLAKCNFSQISRNTRLKFPRLGRKFVISYKINDKLNSRNDS